MVVTLVCFSGIGVATLPIVGLLYVQVAGDHLVAIVPYITVGSSGKMLSTSVWEAGVRTYVVDGQTWLVGDIL
jgi:hypothetical protein